MTPLTARVLVAPGQDPQILHLHAPALTGAAARVLMQSTLLRERAALTPDGLFRVQLGGPGRSPVLTVERLGNRDDGLAVAVVRRESAQAASIISTTWHPPPGSPDRDWAALISEAAATAVRHLEDGQECVVDAVVRP